MESTDLSTQTKSGEDQLEVAELPKNDAELQVWSGEKNSGDESTRTTWLVRDADRGTWRIVTMATDVLLAAGLPFSPDCVFSSPLHVWSMDRFVPSSRQPPHWSRNFNWRNDQRSKSCLEASTEPRRASRKNRGSEVYGQGVTLRAEDLLEESDSRLHPLGKSKVHPASYRLPGVRRSTVCCSLAADAPASRSAIRRRSEGCPRPATPSSSSSGQADESSPITSSAPTSSCPDSSSSSSSSFSDSGSNCEYCRLTESSDTLEGATAATTSSDCDDERSTSSSSTRQRTPTAPPRQEGDNVRPRRFRRHSPGDYLRHERDRLERLRKRALQDPTEPHTVTGHEESRTREKSRRSRRRNVTPESRRVTTPDKEVEFSDVLPNGSASDESLKRNELRVKSHVDELETVRGEHEAKTKELEAEAEEEEVPKSDDVTRKSVVMGKLFIVEEAEYGGMEGDDQSLVEIGTENVTDVDAFYDVELAVPSRFAWQRDGSRSLDSETERRTVADAPRGCHSEPEPEIVVSGENLEGSGREGPEARSPEADFRISGSAGPSRNSRNSSRSASGSKGNASSSRCTTCTRFSSKEEEELREECPLCAEEKRPPRPTPSPRFLRADFKIEPEIIHRANPLVDEAEVGLSSGAFRRLSEDEFVAILSIHEAARKGDLHVVKLLTKRDAKQMETVDERGWTPIHLAAANGHAEVVRYLATEGAHVSALDPSSYTSVHLAAMNGHNNCLEVLLPLGVDVDSVTAEGFTALHLAVMNVHLECCQTLLQWGASLERKDALGRCVHDLIEEYDLRDVAALLARFRRQVHSFRAMISRFNRSGESRSPIPDIPRELLEILASIAEEDSATD